MLATLAPDIFDDPDWLFERKWDGYRIIATISDGTVCLYSRNGVRYNHQYPNVAAALSVIAHDVIFDGEIVVEDTEGRENFAALQNYGADFPGQLRYYIFDMLHLNSYSMIDLPLIERKSLIPGTLSELVDGGELVRYCDHVAGEGKKFYNRALAESREGIIAKKADSVYRPGSRSDRWLKIKAVASEEAIICGYTESVQGGALFGSLILGMYQNSQLHYIGNCGSGFSQKEQERLLKKLASLKCDSSFFDEPINLRGRTPHWIVPKLVCEVKFSEWTSAGRLRHPVYKGLRPDKNTTEIQLVNLPMHRETEVKKGLKITDFNITTMPSRLEKVGDLFGPVLGEGIDMQKALTALDEA